MRSHLLGFVQDGQGFLVREAPFSRLEGNLEIGDGLRPIMRTGKLLGQCERLMRIARWRVVCLQLLGDKSVALRKTQWPLAGEQHLPVQHMPEPVDPYGLPGRCPFQMLSLDEIARATEIFTDILEALCAHASRCRGYERIEGITRRGGSLRLTIFDSMSSLMVCGTAAAPRLSTTDTPSFRLPSKMLRKRGLPPERCVRNPAMSASPPVMYGAT